MCGRFTLTIPDVEAVAALIGAELAPSLKESYRPRYNLPPTDPHMIVKLEGKRRLVPARWGFGKPGEKPLINARAESAAKNGLFKRAFAERRCLVPADGFFEWMGAAKARRPIWYHRPGELILLGGLYHYLDDGFAILTTTASPDVAPVHDRMPVIIQPKDIDAWLDVATAPAAVQALCAPMPKGFLTATPVSPRANSVANDDPSCIEPDTTS